MGNHVNPDRKIHSETSSFSFIFNSYTAGNSWQGPSDCIKQYFGSQKLCIPETLVESLLVESGAILGRSFLSQEGMTTIHHTPQSTTTSGTPSVPHLCGLCASRAFLPSVIQNSCWETNITMENHHFQWENPLYNSYVKLPEVITITGLTQIVFQSQLVESKWT